MAEYLAPGVYVEEVSFRSKSIEGVSTTTTGFVGPARYGPVTLEPDVLTSLLDFERVYGDRLQLAWGNDQYHNYLWHAVRAFFEEGGKRLYVARVFRPMLGKDNDPKTAVYVPPSPNLDDDDVTPMGGLYQHDGHARAWLTKETAKVGAAVQAVKDVSAAFSAAKTAMADFQEKAQEAARLASDAVGTELRIHAAAWTVKKRLAEIKTELGTLGGFPDAEESNIKNSAQTVFDLLKLGSAAASSYAKLSEESDLDALLQEPVGAVYEKIFDVQTKAQEAPFDATDVKGAATAAIGVIDPFLAGGVTDAVDAASQGIKTAWAGAPQGVQQARALALAAAQTVQTRLTDVGTKLESAKNAKNAIPASFTRNTIDPTASKNALDIASVTAGEAVDVHLNLSDALVPQSVLEQVAAALADAADAAKTALPINLTPFTDLNVPAWDDVAHDLGEVGTVGTAINDADTTASAADTTTNPDSILLALALAAEAAENTQKTDKKTIGAVQATPQAKHQDALTAQTTVHALSTAANTTRNAAIFAAEPRAFLANKLDANVVALAAKVDELAAMAAETNANVIADAPTFNHQGAILLRARFPGFAGNFQVRFTLRFGQNTLVAEQGRNAVRNLSDGDLVWIGSRATPTSGELLIAHPNEDVTDWSFSDRVGTIKFWLNQPQPPTPGAPKLNNVTQILFPVTLAVEVFSVDGNVQTWDGLALQPGHTRAGAEDSVTAKFGVEPASAADAQTLPIVLLADSSVDQAIELCETLFEQSPVMMTGDQLSIIHILLGGNDGQRPAAAEYEGVEEDFYKTGLHALKDIEDISIVAAPGSTYGLESGYRQDALTIINALISHAERMRYRIAVLDSGDNQSIAQVRDLRGRIDSKYAAIYYPWVKILDPVTRAEINLPPSGFVAGIYARNDIQRAVWKAPANEVVNLAIGFEKTLNKGQQEVLNPEGINCFRYFPGRGYRLWGARTTSSDPEWKYVNLRRYFAYVEHSVDKGTQWAVFEPNGERLWDNVRRTVYDFLLNEWQNGALLGEKPEKAFFVRCDRSTMTQNDLDNGRLVCLVGIAPLRPAEYVIFRIGQWTADRKV